MPPKAAWVKPSLQTTPKFTDPATAAAVRAPASAEPSAHQAAERLKAFVVRTITDQNLLQLAPAEIQTTAELLVTTKDKSEIFNWCKTLMQPEAFATEIIKRREDIAAAFARKEANAAAHADTASSVGGGSRATTLRTARTGATTVGGRGKRGAMKTLTSVDDGTGGLVVGAEFECGCFATQHQFKGNCLNCGRIFCMQEAFRPGSGGAEGEDLPSEAAAEAPGCYACGLDPTRCMLYDLKVQHGRIDAAAATKNAAEYERAVAQRDQLLRYARERTKRTMVVDDQSGMFNSAFSNVFSTKAERDAALAANAAERKRIEALHKRSGAFQIHLDIVNKNTALGACALLQSTEDALLAKERDRDGRPELKASDVGFDDTPLPADDGRTAPAAPAVPDAIAALRVKSHRDDGDAAFDESSDSELADGDGEDDGVVRSGDARVVPLPTLMQEIFYCRTEQDAARATASVSKLTKKRDGDDADGGAPAGAAKGRKEMPSWRDAEKKVGDAGRGAGAASRRVQTEHFEEDNVTWRVARAARRNPNLGHEDVDGGFGGEGSDDDEGGTARRGVRSRLRSAPERVDPAAPTVAVGAAAAAAAAGGDDEDGAAGPSPADGARISDAEARARLIRKLGHRDEGWCLSMHQPWASLLVAGIKRTEGRGWNSDHRGRLWIHAAGAKPTPAQIEELEAHYAPHLAPGQKFPTHYPTSCLLGHVTVLDVVDEATHRAERPGAPDCSPFNFVCEAPSQLPFFLAMDGKHKIFKLDRKLWQAARKQLGESPTPR